MPDNSEQLQATAADSLKSLKKIIASRGKLQGNFYYVGHPKGDEAAIVITLTARDPKGTKATARGKALRRVINGAKFAQGTVISSGSKLSFELHAGNATRDHMKAGFKRGFEDKDLKSLKALLRKARFHAPGSTEPEEAVDEEVDGSLAEEEDAAVADLSVRERAELIELIEIQGDLQVRNRELAQALQAAEAAQRELEAQISALTDEIERAEAADPTDPRLTELQQQLAELFYVGEDPYPGGGQPMHTIDRVLLAVSSTLTVEQDGPPDGVAYRKALLSWDFAKRRSAERLAALRRSLLEEYPEESDAAARLDGVLASLNEGLADALDEALSTGETAERRAAAGRALSIARRYQAFVSTSPLIQHIDRNPYLDTGIQQRLSDALEQIIGHLG
jgi:hypothetical protein